MWTVISGMKGLEEIKVSFRLLIDGWMGWTEEEVLKPLYTVRQPLKVFEVEMPLSSGSTGAKVNPMEKDMPFKLIKY
jgi:hypothetical protein